MVPKSIKLEEAIGRGHLKTHIYRALNKLNILQENEENGKKENEKEKNDKNL